MCCHAAIILADEELLAVFVADSRLQCICDETQVLAPFETCKVLQPQDGNSAADVHNKLILKLHARPSS